MKLGDVKKLFNMPLKEAAKKLNITEEALMMFIKEHHFEYWVLFIIKNQPYDRLKKCDEKLREINRKEISRLENTIRLPSFMEGFGKYL